MNYLIETFNGELTITLLEISVIGDFAKHIVNIISKTDKTKFVKVVVDLRLSERIESEFFDLFYINNIYKFPVNFIGIQKIIPICRYL